MYLYRSSMESHFRNMRGVAGINKHQLKWPQSASVAISDCTTDACSVNDLSINGRRKSRVTTYKVFLAGYSILKNYYIYLYICHVKTFLRYIGVFAKWTCFH